MKTSEKAILGLGAVAVAYFVFREAAPPPGKATLVVDTEPIKAGVYLEGTYRGVAPQTFELDPGDYAVGFGEVEGYIAPGTTIVTLNADESVTLMGTYEPAGAPPDVYSLAIFCSPEVNAAISANGVGIGATPIELDLEAGQYIVAITVPDGYYLDYWQDDTGEDLGRVVDLAVDLQRDAALTAVLGEGELYCCSYCPACFPTMMELMLHMMTEHPEAW